MKLTKREKALLMLLAFVAVFVGLGCGILLPLSRKASDLAASAASAEDEKARLEQKISMLASLQEQKEERFAEAEKTGKQFYSRMTAAEIDQLMSETASKHQAVMKEFSVDVPEEGEYAKLLPYTADQESAESSEETDESEEDSSVYTGIYQAKATMVLSGSRADLEELLDEFASGEPKLRVASFEWKDEEDGSALLSVDLDLYMTELPEEEEAETNE